MNNLFYINNIIKVNRGVLLMKALLIALCLLLMVIFIVFEKREKYLLAVILKGLASCMFVLLGLWCSRVITDPQFVKMVRIGLILGLIADILLNL